MTGRLAGRVAVVTGAARGLGEAIAARLLQEGARTAICDVDGDALDGAAGRFRDRHGEQNLLARRTDVADGGTSPG